MTGSVEGPHVSAADKTTAGRSGIWTVIRPGGKREKKRIVMQWMALSGGGRYVGCGVCMCVCSYGVFMENIA